MKKALTVSLAGVALAATLSLVGADSFKRGQTMTTDALPANDILTTVRSMGLDPTTEPLRRGPYYVLHAYDPYGVEVRVVADAQLGDILSTTPAQALNNAYAPIYERGPRIIHVPQHGERDEPDAAGNDDNELATPPPRHRTTPRESLRGDASPPPPDPRRNVQSAAPLPAEGPTPIRPTPRFNAKANEIDKSSTPDNAAAASEPSPPPADNTPPAALPRGNGPLAKRKRPGCPGRCRCSRLMLRC